MSKIGFNNSKEDNNNTTKTDQVERYKHVVRLFGIPIFSSTKNHTIDSKVVEDK